MTEPSIHPTWSQMLDLPGFIVANEFVRSARSRRRKKEMWADYTASIRRSDPHLFIYPQRLGFWGTIARSWRYLRGLWK